MPKNLYKRNGIWWAEKVHQGKRHRFSLETASLRDAQRRLVAKIAELTATNWGENPRRSFDEAAIRFVKEHLPTLKPSSEKRYMVSLGQLAPHFQGALLDEIGTGRLYDFEYSRTLAGASPGTIRRDLSCLSSLLSSAITWEWAEKNPVPGYIKSRVKKGLKESDPRSRYLNHDEEDRLLEKCNEAMRDAIVFAIETGLRKEEQFSLMRHHIDFHRAVNDPEDRGPNIFDIFERKENG